MYKSKDSFVRAQNWISELQKQGSPNIMIALAGNKTDLENIRAVPFEASTCLWYSFVFYKVFHHYFVIMIFPLIFKCVSRITSVRCRFSFNVELPIYFIAGSLLVELCILGLQASKLFIWNQEENLNMIGYIHILAFGFNCFEFFMLRAVELNKNKWQPNSEVVIFVQNITRTSINTDYLWN